MPENLRCMAVDPGFASIGLAVLEAQPQGVISLGLHLIETKKAEKKERTGLRVNIDDQRRMQEVWEKLGEHFEVYKPNLMAFETYAPRPGRVTSWKTALVCGLVQGFAWSKGLHLHPFLPADLKRAFGGKLSATKQAVAEDLCTKVAFLSEQLNEIPKTKREHVADAVGHAYLGIQEAQKLRASAGFV